MKYIKCFKKNGCQLSQELVDLGEVIRKAYRPLLKKVRARDLMTVEAAMCHVVSLETSLERLHRLLPRKRSPTYPPKEA